MLIHEMTETECLSTLAHTRLGRLACAHNNQPYVVPIYFVYEGSYLYGFLYGFTTLGLKVEWMRSNPLVCVELDEVENFDQWTSIVIFGRYEELPDLLGTSVWDQNQRRAHGPSQPMVRPKSVSSTPGQQARLHAHELLQQHAEWWEPGCASRTHHNPDQPLTPIFYRIRIDRTTGRRATRSPGGPVASRISAPPRDSQGWLRRVFHALFRPFASRKGMEKYG